MGGGDEIKRRRCDLEGGVDEIKRRQSDLEGGGDGLQVVATIRLDSISLSARNGLKVK